MIKAAKAMRAKLIIIDTLARTFGDGDENSAQSMNAFVEKLDLIKAATGSRLAVVHHSTKEGSSSRGSGALEGAADLIVKITRGTDKQLNRAIIEPAKGDLDGAVWAFKLEPFDLEPREYGEPRMTCIAEDAEAGPALRKPLSANTMNDLRILNDVIAKSGKQPSQRIDWPSAKVLGVSKAKRDQECESRGLSLAEKRQDRNRVFRRAAGELLNRKIIVMRDDWVWVVRSDEIDV